VTQYLHAPAEDVEEVQRILPPPRGVFLSCLGCCFRGDDAKASPSGSGLGDGESSQSSQLRPLYIPPAPHVGKPFIPPLAEADVGKKTLVLDLDETLVHSSFKPVPNPDYIIPVEIDGKARVLMR
jgi:hypothetical protein